MPNSGSVTSNVANVGFSAYMAIANAPARELRHDWIATGHGEGFYEAEVWLPACQLPVVAGALPLWVGLPSQAGVWRRTWTDQDHLYGVTRKPRYSVARFPVAILPVAWSPDEALLEGVDLLSRDDLSAVRPLPFGEALEEALGYGGHAR